MSIRTMLVHRLDVQKIPDTPSRDSSGGIIDSSWTDVVTNVPCSVHPLSASKMADFTIAGMSITHNAVTLQSGILAGQRLKIVDALGTTYLRVVTVKAIRGRGTIGTFFEIAGEEVRLQ